MPNKYVSIRKTGLDSESPLKISNFIENKMNTHVHFSIRTVSTDVVLMQLNCMSTTNKATDLDGFSVNLLKYYLQPP